MLQSEDMKTSRDENFQEPEQLPDSIQRIVLEYHSKTSADTSAGKIEIDYSEQLIMGHNEEKLELVKTIGSGCSITHTFFLPYAIRNLLDRLEPEQWQKPLPDAPDDLIDTEGMRETRMLCRMIDLKITAQLMDAAQTLKLPGIQAVPDDLQIDMHISMDRVTEHLYF